MFKKLCFLDKTSKFSPQGLGKYIKSHISFYVLASKNLKNLFKSELNKRCLTLQPEDLLAIFFKYF